MSQWWPLQSLGRQRDNPAGGDIGRGVLSSTFGTLNLDIGNAAEGVPYGLSNVLRVSLPRRRSTAH